MTFKGNLRPYQEEAVDKMVDRGQVLLGMVMGAGKTPTTIAACERLRRWGEINRTLVIVPSALKYQWRDELTKFSDARVIVVDGTASQRDKHWRMSFGANYVIVNPESLLKDEKKVGDYQCVVVDEATMIKTRYAGNKKVKRTALVKRLGKKVFYRFALTGQPIENKPEELFCADDQTEVMSRRGWLSHSDLTTDDVVLTLNHSTGRSEWQPVLAVNRFDVEGEEMVSLEHRSHSSLTTVNHRWPVERRWYGQDGSCHRRAEWATSTSFKRMDHVPIAAPCATLPEEPLHSDSLVELVAWLYTEGHVRKNPRGGYYTSVNIGQNNGTVGEMRIRSALKEEFGTAVEEFPRTGSQTDGVARWRVDCSDPGHTVFKLNVVAGAALLHHAPDKVPSFEFLSSLTLDQLELFIDVSMMADRNGEHAFSQKSCRAAEAFQFAATLSGRAVSFTEHSTDHDRQGMPYRMTRVCLRRREFFAPQNCNSRTGGELVRYTGTVWCPTTPNGTWFARRNGSTYFTGNSIMEFVDPDVLGDWKQFDNTFIVRDRYGKPMRYRNLDLVYENVSEAMVRYSFDDIKDQMPKVIHQTIPVVFDRKGAKVYEKVTGDLLEKIREAIRKKVAISYASDDEVSGEVMTRLTTLRMLCDNPALVTYSAALYGSRNHKGGSQYAASLVKTGALDTLKAAPKLDACLDYIEEVLSEDPKNKVVLFSTFKKNLSIIEMALAKGGYQSVLFTGDMSAAEKKASKDEFSSDPECRVFLSSDAGGYGVDLPMANYLISYDLPWSSGKLEQREARIIRLSSEFPHVTIASFVMAGSIEERQHEMLKQKKRINEAWIDGKHHDATAGMEIDVGTLTSFLETSRV